MHYCYYDVLNKNYLFSFMILENEDYVLCGVYKYTLLGLIKLILSLFHKE